MRTITRTLTLVTLLIALTSLAGCGSKDDGTTPTKSGGASAVTADEKASVDQLKTEAAKMDEATLKTSAENYSKAITDKQAELDKIMEDLKSLPPAEMIGDKAVAAKDKMAELTASVNALKERMQVFVDELQKKGVDVSGLTQ